MTRKYVFADESGNFDFSRQPSATRYFILTSITLDHCDVGNALLELRREMTWRGVQLRGEFHATEDEQSTRDEVFKLLADIDFRVDATILEKPKAKPHLQQDETLFYKTAWYQHMKHVALRIATAEDELLVCCAADLSFASLLYGGLVGCMRAVSSGSGLLLVGDSAKVGAQRCAVI